MKFKQRWSAVLLQLLSEGVQRTHFHKEPATSQFFYGDRLSTFDASLSYLLKATSVKPRQQGRGTSGNPSSPNLRHSQPRTFIYNYNIGVSDLNICKVMMGCLLGRLCLEWDIGNSLMHKCILLPLYSPVRPVKHQNLV